MSNEWLAVVRSWPRWVQTLCGGLFAAFASQYLSLLAFAVVGLKVKQLFNFELLGITTLLYLPFTLLGLLSRRAALAALVYTVLITVWVLVTSLATGPGRPVGFWVTSFADVAFVALGMFGLLRWLLSVGIGSKP